MYRPCGTHCTGPRNTNDGPSPRPEPAPHPKQRDRPEARGLSASFALDSFGGRIGTSYIGAAGLIGTDLRNDHPISFTYDDALAVADRELFLPGSAASGLGGTIQTDLLFNNKMECSSCHDVHNSVGVPDLLVKSNAGSALCLTCHDK